MNLLCHRNKGLYWTAIFYCNYPKYILIFIQVFYPFFFHSLFTFFLGLSFGSDLTEDYGEVLAKVEKAD